MSRIDDILKYKQNQEIIENNKQILEEQEKKTLIEQIRSLKPRIDQLLDVGNACRDAEIPLTGQAWGGYEGYDTNQFVTNCWSHLVGFVNPNKAYPITEMGINAGGACGEWDFRTNGVQVYELSERTHATQDPQIGHMRRFLKEFDHFEESFYSYVDKLVNKNNVAVLLDIDARDIGTQHLNVTVPAVNKFPLSERDETMEMNCQVFDDNDKFLYEAFFTCKCGWLQDYFGVDNRSQLEAIWDVGDSWEDPDNFLDAFSAVDLSGFQINALVRDNVRVEWEAIGEGLHGDYDAMDPEDIELLRFSVSVLRDGLWEEKKDGSYCTQFPVSATAVEKLAGLEILLEQFYDALSADIDVSVKRLGEQLSWISPAYVANHKLSFSPFEPNASDGLIKAMVAYGLEHSWSDGEIVHSLTKLGITHDDFCHAGAQAFVKNFLEPSIHKKNFLLDQIQSASVRATESQSAEKASVKGSISER